MSLLSEYEQETDPGSGTFRALPLRAYSSPDVFDLELERVFHRDWVAVCGVDDLNEAGDYHALSLAGEPIVVIRGADGVPAEYLSSISADLKFAVLESGH